MLRRPNRAAVLISLLLTLLVLPACQSERVEDDGAPARTEPLEARFSATIDGVVRYPMQGQAYYLLNDEGQLIGLELNQEGEGVNGGISFELEPLEPTARVYTVASAEERSSPEDEEATMMAFLDGQNHRFTTVGGTLRLEENEGGQLRGTFDLQMEGYLDEQSADEVEAVVAGEFAALPERAL